MTKTSLRNTLAYTSPSFLLQRLFEHTDLYKITGYSGSGSGCTSSRTETDVMVCDNEEKCVKSKPQVEWKSERIIDLM